MFGAFSNQNPPCGNKTGLREVGTVFDVQEMNEAQRQGCICIVKRKVLNPELNLTSLLLRNRNTAEFVVVPDRMVYRQYALDPLLYTEGEWELVQKIEGYARRNRSESNWGAYILPSDAAIDERFYIRELIEDLVATAFWYSVTPAETATAAWDGQSLNIDHSSYRYELVG